MKRLLPVFAVLAVALGVSSAFAAITPVPNSLNLAWGDCGAAGTADKAFACGVNTGSDNLYGSYLAPTGTTGVTGAEAVCDFIAAGGSWPAWWEFGTGGCRATGMSIQFNTPCASANDYWGSIPGGALGGFGFYLPAANTAALYSPRNDASRLKVVCAVDGTAATAITAGSEYYAFTMNLKHTNTTGAGSCAGCTTPICIVFNSILITQGLGVGDYLLSGPATGTSDWATYQGGAGASCAAVPVRNTTWGQVKSLYR